MNCESNADGDRSTLQSTPVFMKSTSLISSEDRVIGLRHLCALAAAFDLSLAAFVKTLDGR